MDKIEMESTIDLILKGQFEQIRRDVTQPGNTSKALAIQEILEEVVAYLQKQDNPEAMALVQKIKGWIEPDKDLLSKLGKKPMKKAGKKPAAGSVKKAM